MFESFYITGNGKQIFPLCAFVWAEHPRIFAEQTKLSAEGYVYVERQALLILERERAGYTIAFPIGWVEWIRGVPAWVVFP